MDTQRVIQTTRKRLLGQRGRYRQIAQHGRLTYSWVSKFATGEIGKRPSYDLIQRLIAALDAFEAGQARVPRRPALRNAHRKAPAMRTSERKRG